jgi:periplasmic protein CpxP/Spy
LPLILPAAPERQHHHALPEPRKDTPMSRLPHPLAVPAPFARSVAIAAFLGATMLASPMTTARADSTSTAPSHVTPGAAPRTKAAAGAMATKTESVEQRISSLHTALKITPQEEANWTAVAQAMRDNAAAMQKLATDSTDQSPQSKTAMDDLKTYQKFAQAHVDGLKNLTSSFETLYDAMPDPQKKVADQVFESSRHHGVSSHS